MTHQGPFTKGRAVSAVALSIVLPAILGGCLALPVQPGADFDPEDFSPEDIREATMLATMVSVELGGIDRAEVPKILRILDQVEQGLMMGAPPDFARARAFVGRETRGATKILVTMVITRAERYWPFFVDRGTEHRVEQFRTLVKAVIDGGREGLALAA